MSSCGSRIWETNRSCGSPKRADRGECYASYIAARANQRGNSLIHFLKPFLLGRLVESTPNVGADADAYSPFSHAIRAYRILRLAGPFGRDAALSCSVADLPTHPSAGVRRHAAHPASLRPCRTIHSPAFGRFDEIWYLFEKGIRPHPPGLCLLPHPVA
jgi:hypothetical protein